MAIILRKGQEFVTGSGTGAENTIQSFNGGIGGTKGNMYVDLIIDGADITITPNPVSVTGTNQFEVSTASTPVSSRLEVGDAIVLYDNDDEDATRHNAEIASITDNGTNTEMMVFITDPHNDPHTTSATGLERGDVSRSTRFVTVSGITFTPAIAAGHAPIYRGDINSIVFDGNPDTDSYEVVEGPGVEAYEVNANGNIVITYRNTQRASVAVVDIQAALANSNSATTGTVDLTYHSTTEEFDKMDGEHRIHVGSKTNTTVAVVTPITLPSGLTIRAGSGVGDIFLIKVTE